MLVPAHDLWTTLDQLQERLATATPDEAARLQAHVVTLRQRLAGCGPAPTVVREADREALPTHDLDAQWQAILEEAQGAPIEQVPEATVSRPMARTLAPRLMFSAEFLALGDLPDELAKVPPIHPSELVVD